VKNTEQLSGTLCHEVSHTIHRDSMNKLKREKSVERREIGAAILLGANVSPNDRNRHARKPELARLLARRRILGRRDWVGHLRSCRLQPVGMIGRHTLRLLKERGTAGLCHAKEGVES
jgi:hypothetical protein